MYTKQIFVFDYLFWFQAIPKKAFMPKLQLDMTKGKQRVEMERQRRKYANVDVGRRLLELGVSPEDMARPKELDEFDPAFTQGHFLALELFDDEDFESRSSF